MVPVMLPALPQCTQPAVLVGTPSMVQQQPLASCAPGTGLSSSSRDSVDETRRLSCGSLLALTSPSMFDASPLSAEPKASAERGCAEISPTSVAHQLSPLSQSQLSELLGL